MKTRVGTGWACVILASGTVAACSVPPTAADAGFIEFGGGPDGSSGSTDAGSGDSGSPDAGVTDGGPTATDAGTSDAGLPNSGNDGGSGDAGCSCPSTGTLCTVASCLPSGQCTTTSAQVETPCSDHGGSVCDGIGSCVACASDGDCPASTTTCAVAVCVTSMCVTTTAEGGTSCADGGYSCNGSGDCVPTNSGTSCSTGSECSSGSCAPQPDGGPSVCCSTPCPDEGAALCGSNGVCDGSGACQSYPDGTTCAGQSICSGGKCVGEVFGQSATTLYVLDPITDVVKVVGNFVGCDTVIDIAINKSGQMYATTYSGFYSVNKATAVCTLIALGTYPNSLSFVPAGTLDPTAEALVGYNSAEYVRIDPTTGALTSVGSLGSQGYTSSGDIVSVIGGGTYLTVQGGPQNCGDCIVEVDPSTGALMSFIGALGHSAVYGLAYWGGAAYGFDEAGQLFKINLTTGASTTITIPSAPSGLSFYGAGSSTAVPVKGPT